MKASGLFYTSRKGGWDGALTQAIAGTAAGPGARDRLYDRRAESFHLQHVRQPEMGGHRSRSSSSERVPTARTSQPRFFCVARTSEYCCWTPAVCWYRSTCKTSAGWALTRPRRSRRPVTLASLGLSCGACRGAVTSTFPDWRIVLPENLSTGEDGAHGLRRKISCSGRPAWLRTSTPTTPISRANQVSFRPLTSSSANSTTSCFPGLLLPHSVCPISKRRSETMA